MSDLILTFHPFHSLLIRNLSNPSSRFINCPEPYPTLPSRNFFSTLLLSLSLGFLSSLFVFTSLFSFHLARFEITHPF